MDNHRVGNCPLACGNVRAVLSRVGDSWSVLIIMALDGMGKMRFNEIKRHLGISQRMLSLTLRELERDGLVRRTVFGTVPPRVEYELTPLGQSFADPVRILGDWAVSNLDQIESARAAFEERGESRSANPS